MRVPSFVPEKFVEFDSSVGIKADNGWGLFSDN